MKDNGLLFLEFTFGICVALLVGMLSFSGGYKQGQLDYQRGTVEYIIQGDTVLHVIKE